MTLSYRIYLTDVADTEVEVQAYVAGWSTQRGRSRELDTFSAGTFSLSLQNYDGRFLPEAFNGTTSPYGSDVAVPGRGCRIQVDGGDGWRTVFYGFVEDTAWDYDNQRWSVRVSPVSTRWVVSLVCRCNLIWRCGQRPERTRPAHGSTLSSRTQVGTPTTTLTATSPPKALIA
jgi:hypothetical protein